MLKKYLPFIFLIAAALLLFYVKKHQRGDGPKRTETTQTEGKITVPAILPADEKTDEVEGMNRR